MNLKNNLLDFKQLSFPWNRRRKRFFRVLKIAIIFLIVLIIAGGIFIYPYLNYTKEVYSLANQGKANLEKAQEYAVELDMENASYYLTQAESDFTLARDKFRKFYIFKYTPFIGQQIQAIDNLLITGIETSSAAKEVVLVIQDILETVEESVALEGQLGIKDSGLSFSQLTKSQKREILKTFFEIVPKLQGAKAKIDLAVEAFNRIPEDEIFSPIKRAIQPLRELLPKLQETITKAIPASEVLPQVLGYPMPKTYLFLLQNNDEMRPTGGFIGTYGIVKLDSGDLVSFSTDDIYKLDFAVEQILNVEPPEPLKKYLGAEKWFLRDANWSPDFPTSAQQALWFYDREIQPHLRNTEEEDDWKATVAENVNGVIAITPDIIEDLIKLTGPATISGQTFTAENLVDKLQYQVEVGYYEEGIPEIQRKEIVADLATELKNRLFNLPIDQWPKMLDILKSNLNEKQILIYDNNPNLQLLIEQNNWGGEVENYDGDYLLAVDANLASLKTDQVMSRKINYNVSADRGGLIAEVVITYTNGGTFSWKTTRYRTYTRVYVPTGSELISAEGLMANDKIKDPARSPGQVDVGEELGKTYFGGFISIEPGETRSLSFKYRLPNYIKKQYDDGLYKLFVQKQAGTENHSLTIDLNFDKKIKAWLPQGYSARRVSDEQIKFIYTLRKDRESIVEF